MYQSNLRLGTAQTKSRGEVAGSTKKMYRQKGTGNARAGSRRSGIRRGGGHIFAKRPRDWTYRLPRKAVQLATRMALASKIRDEQVTVIDELKFDAPKTNDMAGILKALDCHEGNAAGGHGRPRRQCVQDRPAISTSRSVAGGRLERLERAAAAAGADDAHRPWTGSRIRRRRRRKSPPADKE